jgi:hypothetical protein
MTIFSESRLLLILTMPFSAEALLLSTNFKKVIYF